MKAIKIFTDLTTNEHLDNLAEKAKTYVGLYVDMDQPEERRYVKEHASLIEDIRKKIDRARIDKAKAFRNDVEAEAKLIDDALVKANKPFITLIDKYKEKRAKYLAKKKAEEEAEALKIQIESDHDEAILLDEMREFKIAEGIRLQKERDEQIAKEAREKAEKEAKEAEARAKQAEIDKIAAQKLAEQQKIEAEEAAKQAELDRVEAAKQAKIDAAKAAKEAEKQAKIDAEAAAKQATIDAENAQKAKEAKEAKELEARENNKKHIGKIRKEAKESLMSHVNEKAAKDIVMAVTRGEIANVTINY